MFVSLKFVRCHCYWVACEMLVLSDNLKPTSCRLQLLSLCCPTIFIIKHLYIRLLFLLSLSPNAQCASVVLHWFDADFFLPVHLCAKINIGMLSLWNVKKKSQIHLKFSDKFIVGSELGSWAQSLTVYLLHQNILNFLSQLFPNRMHWNKQTLYIDQWNYQEQHAVVRWTKLGFHSHDDFWCHLQVYTDEFVMKLSVLFGMTYMLSPY